MIDFIFDPKVPYQTLESILSAIRDQDVLKLTSLLQENGIPTSAAHTILDNDLVREKRILLLRSRILYLREQNAKAIAAKWGPILIGEIISGNVSLFTLLYLASEPEAMLRISIRYHMRGDATSNVNEFIRKFRDNSFRCEQSRLSGYNYAQPNAEAMPPGNFRIYYLKIAARYGHDQVLDKLLDPHMGPLIEKIVNKAVKYQQPSSIQIIAKHYPNSVPRCYLKKAIALASENDDLDMIDLLIDKLGATILCLEDAQRITSMGILSRFVDHPHVSNQQFLNVMIVTLKSGFRDGFEFMRHHLESKYPMQLPFNYDHFIVPSIIGNLFDIFCWLMDHPAGPTRDKPHISFSLIIDTITRLDRVDFVRPFIFPNYPEVRCRQYEQITNWSDYMNTDARYVFHRFGVHSWRQKFAACILGELIVRNSRPYDTFWNSNMYQVGALVLTDPLYSPYRITAAVSHFNPNNYRDLLYLAWLPNGCQAATDILATVMSQDNIDLEIVAHLLNKGTRLATLPKPKSAHFTSWRTFIGQNNQTISSFMPLILSRVFFEWWQDADAILDSIFSRGVDIRAQDLEMLLRRRPGGHYYPGCGRPGPDQLARLFIRLIDYGISGGLAGIPGWAMRHRQGMLLEKIEGITLPPSTPANYDSMLESAAMQGDLHYVQLACQRGAKIKFRVDNLASVAVKDYLRSL